MSKEKQLNTVTLDKETLEKIKPLRIIDDALGNGQTLTHISRCQRVDNKYLPVDDGEDIILANTEIKDNTKHTRLLQLFLKSDSFYDEMFPALSEAMKYYKEDERGQDTVSEVTKQWKREGYEEGLAAGKELVEKEKSKARKAEKRAKAAEARAQAAEEELARLKSMIQ